MAARQVQQPSQAPFILLGGLILAGAAFYTGWPGVPAIWLALVITAWMEPPVMLTGKKDASGYATPAGPGEERNLQRYSMWRELKWRLIVPNTDWAPGWPVLGSFIGGVVAAAAAFTIPTIDTTLRFANAGAAFLVVAVVMGVRRRTLAEDMCPGARIDSLPELAKSKPQFIVAGVVAAAAAGTAAHIFIPVWDTGSAGEGGPATTAQVDPENVLSPLVDYGTRTPLVATVSLALLAFLAAIAVPWTNKAIGHWRVVVAARKEWRPRWQALKFDPAPFLIDRQEVGVAVVDTFMAPPGQGAAAFFALVPKIQPTVGAGSRIAVLSTPNEGPEGPVPGTTHPLRFEVVNWPMDGFPDFAEPEIDPEVVALGARCAFSWGVDVTGVARPVLLGIEPVHAPGSPASAWESKWAWPGGPGLTTIRSTYLGDVAASFECETLIDHRRDSLFFGGLITGAPEEWQDSGTIAFPEIFERLKREDDWNYRWSQVLKQGAQAPVPEHSTASSALLADGTEVFRQAFTTRMGVDPREFATSGMEKKIATSLVGVPFCTVGGWNQSSDRAGERHSQAIAIYWCPSPVPTSPQTLAPTSASRGMKATDWVLVGHINKAFDGARLPRPEIASSTCLTDPEARRGHIWEIKLRLHDGVTLSDVRGAVGRLKSSLGVNWLRVAPDDIGCVLFAGANPRDTKLLRPAKDIRRLKGLDWEQAWLDSGVSGVGGILPKLAAASVLPSNEQVEVLDFKLPTGVDMATVKNAVSKLMASTNNAFIEVRPGPDASTARLLVCPINPLPERVGYDFEAIDQSDKIPFATGVEGEPIEFDPTESPHALLAGMTGAGKLQPLTTRIPVPVSERFPEGWASVGSLGVGDIVFAPDGTQTKIVALSEIEDRPIHYLHFSDGQVVECGPDHLWKVSSAKSRRVRTPILTGARERRFEDKMAEASRLREAAQQAPVGTLVTLPDLCKVSGLSMTNVHTWIPKDLGVPVQIPTDKKTRVYDGADFVDRLSEICVSRGAVRFGERRFSPSDLEALDLRGKWLTQREIADAMVGGRSTRGDRDRVKGWIRTGAVASLPGGQALQQAVGYPLDECLLLLAEKAERLASCSDSGRVVEPLESIVSTEEMAAHLIDNGGRMNWAVRVAGPIQGVETDLPVDPYVLGAWLGDGSSGSGQFTQGSSEACTDDDGVDDKGHLMAQLEDAGYQPSLLACPKTIGTRGLHSDLKKAGVLVSKHIPATYLRASLEQRLAVLQGLMDTDGTIDEGGRCELTLCNERLATDALELIRSLGIKCAMTSGPASITETDPDRPGEKRRRVTSTRWRMHFVTTAPVFRLPRKANRIPASTRQTRDWNYITDISVGEMVPMRCISIDHPEHLYLTDGFIPTHNSVMAQAFLYGAIVRGWDCYVIDPVKGGADFVFAKDRCRAFAATPFEAAGVMKAVYDDVIQRKTMNAAHGVGSIDELPEDIRPPHVFVFIDEFTSLMGRSLVPKSDDPSMQSEIEMIEAENHARTEIGVYAGKIAREARSAGVHLGLGTQKLTAKMLDTIPGGGDLKLLTLDSLLPVPVSERFPDGWARNRDLVEGDLLYTPKGHTAPIIGFTPVQQGGRVFEVTFGDGQKVRTGPGHWWLASDGASRKQHGRWDALAGSRRLAIAERATAGAASLPDDAHLSPSDLAKLVGYANPARIVTYEKQFGAQRFVRSSDGSLKPYNRTYRRGNPPRRFLVDDAVSVLAGTRAWSNVDALVGLEGSWLTAREMAERVAGTSVAPHVAGNLGTKLIAAGCESKAGEPEPYLLHAPTFLIRLSEHLRTQAKADPSTGGAMPLERLVTTEEMSKQVRFRPDEANWAVRVADAIEGPDVDLPVDPYILGLWLGDGSSSCGQITQGYSEVCTDDQGLTDQAHVIGALAAAGYEPSALPSSRKTVGTRGLRAALRTAGVLNNKHVPPVYLRASKAQRLALLQGLMDTDGSLMASGTCSLPQTSKRIHEGALELIRSLGFKASVSEWDATYLPEGATEKKITGRVHHISFSPNLPVFRLPRKLAKQKPVDATRETTRWNYIQSIEEVESEPVRCIGIDDPDHLYLVEGFIPTHNTNLARTLLGKGSFGDRASALRAPDDAPRLEGEVPKGRGLWEPLSSPAMVVQTWFEKQDRLRAELVERVPELEQDRYIDLSQFTPSSEDDIVPVPMPVSAPVADQVIELEGLELSLDDLELSLDDLDAYDDTDDEDTDDEDDTGSLDGDADQSGPVNGHLSEEDIFGGGIELVEGSVEPAVGIDELDWDIDDEIMESLDPRPDPDPASVPETFTRALSRPDTVVFLDVDGVLFPHQDPPPSTWDDWVPINQPSFDYDHGSPAMCRRIADSGANLVWLTSWEGDMANSSFAGLLGGPLAALDRGAAAYGWWKIDAALAWLNDHPEIRRVVWFDDDLEDIDDDGVHHCDTMSTMLEMLDIEHLLIAPKISEGISPDNLFEMEEWLEESEPHTAPPTETPSSDQSASNGQAVDDDDDPFAGPAWEIPVDHDNPFV